MSRYCYTIFVYAISLSETLFLRPTSMAFYNVNRRYYVWRSSDKSIRERFDAAEHRFIHVTWISLYISSVERTSCRIPCSTTRLPLSCSAPRISLSSPFSHSFLLLSLPTTFHMKDTPNIRLKESTVIKDHSSRLFKRAAALLAAVFEINTVRLRRNYSLPLPI
jgi:hypothetical protein